MYAIVVIIITATIAMIMLYSFSMNNALIQKSLKRKLAEYYVYQGLAMLASGQENGSVRNFPVQDNWVLNVYKDRWGAFDIYTSTVKVLHDTLLTKKALVGWGRMNDSVALRMVNSGSVMHMGDSVHIQGQSIIPFGMIQPYGNTNKFEMPQRLLMANDTLQPLTTDSICSWINKFGTPALGKLYLNDSINASFYEPTRVIKADTLFVNSKIAGNVILIANTIFVDKNLELNDIILSAKYLQIDDDFKGNVQCFASSGIKVGKNCLFNYPSILALVATKPLYSTIDIGDSLFLQGEIYATSVYYQYKKLVSVISNKAMVLGDVYSSGSILFNGNCYGSISCEKLLTLDYGRMEENYLRNITIDRDKLPAFFINSHISPYAAHNKIVKWMY